MELNDLIYRRRISRRRLRRQLQGLHKVIAVYQGDGLQILCHSSPPAHLRESVEQTFSAVLGFGDWNGSGENDTDYAQAFDLRHRFTWFVEPMGFHY